MYGDGTHSREVLSDRTNAVSYSELLVQKIVEFHRNRDHYMRKHHGRLAALAVRVLTAWSYAARALAASVIPGQPAEIYRAHARQALFPARGAGIRDRAAG
jgi:N-acetylglucosaminyl-diphospho-decaprenol L-rhamnosyltransferase